MTDLSSIIGGNDNSPPTAEVQVVRRMLGEAGEQFRHVIEEEFSTIIPEQDGTWSVYTKRKGIHQVVGVYLKTDNEKSRNLYVGTGDWEDPEGKFNKLTGVITLSSTYSYQPMAKVIIDYVHLEGLKDDDIEIVVGWSKSFIMHYTGNNGILFTQQTKEWWALMTVTKYACMLLMNAGSVMQQGYNVRIEEFAVETKAWGEGMIAQFLLAMYKEELDSVLGNLGWGVRSAVATKPKQFQQGDPMRELLL